MMLVVTPKPHPNESLFGYFLRVSELNGYTSMGAILSMAKCDEPQIRSATFNWKPLVPILGGYDLSNYDYLNLTGSMHQLGARVENLHQAPGLWSLSSPKVCPSCVDELGYIEGHWDTAHMIACPKHGYYALSMCESCGKALKWSRPGLLECQCGADLRSFEPMRAPRDTLVLVEFLKCKYYGRPTTRTSFQKQLPVSFSEINLYQLVCLFRLFAKSFPFSHFTKRVAEQEVELAAQILSNWPFRYYDYLESLDVSFDDSRGRQPTLVKQFLPYYSAIKDGRKFGEVSDALVSEFIKFGINIDGKTFVDERLLVRVIGDIDARYVTPSKAGRISGMSPVTLRKWAAKGIIDSTVQTTGTVERTLVDIKNVNIKAYENPDVVLTTRRAAKYVGIPVSILRYLKQVEIFRSISQSTERYGYHIEDLNRMVLKIRNLISQPSENTYHLGDLYSLAYVLTQKRFRGDDGKTQFLADCLSKKIVPVQCDGTSLRDIYYLKTEIDAYIDSQTTKVSHQCISRDQAAEIVEFPADVMNLLFEKGYIDGKNFGGAGLRFFIDSLTKFKKSYVSINKLSKETSVGSRRLLKFCAVDRLNIRLYSVVRKAGQKCHFIEKKDECSVLGYVRKLQDREKRNRLLKESEPSKAEMLERYFEGLRLKREPLPRLNGKPNRSKISRAIDGIGRNDFSRKELEFALQEYDKEDQLRFNLDLRTNDKRLTDYLERLAANGGSIPTKGNKPNKLKISRECGFDRSYFAEDQAALDMLNEFFKSKSIG